MPTPSAPIGPSRRPMRPADIRSVVVVEELDATRDGTAAVVARRVIRNGRYRTHLWLVDLASGGPPRQLTDGPVVDSTPRLSPDGRSVVFTRRTASVGDDTPDRLCLLKLPAPSRRRPGGPPRVRVLVRATAGIGSVDEVVWAPDGRRLAFTAEVDPHRFVVGDEPAVGSRASRSATVPTPRARRITRADWRWDEIGHRDRWTHLFVVELDDRGRPTGSPRQITSGDWGVGQPTWHPDGRTVAFAADRGGEADIAPRRAIWAVDVDAGPRSKRSTPRPVLDAGGGVGRPAYSPDGRWLVAVGILDDDPLDDVSPGLVLGPADAKSPPWPLDPDGEGVTGRGLDRPFGNLADTDLNGWMVDGRPGPFWIDATTIVGVITDRGRALPEQWTIDGRTGLPIDGPSASARSDPGPWADAVTQAVAVSPGSGEAPGRVTVLATLDGRAMEVMTVDLDAAPDERQFRTWTRFGSRWQRRFVEPTMTRLEVPGAGGPIETWVASPPGAGDRAMPTIVDIHGGPLGCWAPAPSLEVTMLVGAGYRVVLPNIRGSTGYGAPWIRAQLGDWGGVDADDVNAAIDHVVAMGLADPDRLGALGLSYGGFMVNWLVGTTDRFRAAVSENGVANQVSAWANSDGGPDYCRAALLGDPFSPEGIEKLWRQSPLRHVADVRTPLLMLQGEADLRCPPQDNEQFFLALRHLRREVEYVLYPESHHTYATTGRPDRRVDRMERVLAWFDRYLWPPTIARPSTTRSARQREKP